MPKLPGHISLDVMISHTAFISRTKEVNQVSDISMKFLAVGKKSLVEKTNQGGAEFTLTGAKGWDYFRSVETGVWLSSLGQDSGRRAKPQTTLLHCCSSSYLIK